MPSLYIIAGPNGAGKTTFVRDFLRFDFAVLDFLNADEIARRLSPLAPERAQLEAGRIMLERVRRFIGEGRDFGMETTLSGRTYRNIFRDARERGYSIHLDFLVLPEVEDSIRRVADRVKSGGHNVPEADLHRRFPSDCRIFSVSIARYSRRGRFTTTRISTLGSWLKETSPTMWFSTRRPWKRSFPILN